MTVSGTADVWIDDLYMGDGGEAAELTINGVRMDIDDLKKCKSGSSIEINAGGSLVIKNADDQDDRDDLNDLIAAGKITTSDPGKVIVSDKDISYDGFFTMQPAIPVVVDIKPGSSSNPLRVNLRGSGVFPVAILGTNDLDVTTIDADAGSATLEGVATVRKGKVGDVNQDGTPDLILKFDRADVLDALEDAHGDLADLPNRAELSLILFAETEDGDLVSGTDTLVVLNRGAIKRRR
jgi:hypothetical protein